MKLNILKTDCLHHRELAKEKKKKKYVIPFPFLLHDLRYLKSRVLRSERE